MRKTIVSEMMTLDGFFAGPDREIDWHNADGEFNEYAAAMLDSADTLVFGRVTYELMAGYWPARGAAEDDPLVAAKMNALEKVVFSRTLEKTGWNNARLAMAGVGEEIGEIKKRPGKDILVLGSGSIVSECARLGLVDEYRIMVNPVILGRGLTLFKDMPGRLKLKLVKTRTFRSGNVLLCYEPADKGKR